MIILKKLRLFYHSPPESVEYFLLAKDVIIESAKSLKLLKLKKGIQRQNLDLSLH